MHPAGVDQFSTCALISLPAAQLFPLSAALLQLQTECHEQTVPPLSHADVIHLSPLLLLLLLLPFPALPFSHPLLSLTLAPSLSLSLSHTHKHTHSLSLSTWLLPSSVLFEAPRYAGVDWLHDVRQHASPPPAPPKAAFPVVSTFDSAPVTQCGVTLCRRKHP